MKKFFCIAAAALTAALLCMALVACGGSGEVISLSASNNVYSHGEQTVQLTFSASESKEYTFAEDISAADIAVGGGHVRQGSHGRFLCGRFHDLRHSFGYGHRHGRKRRGPRFAHRKRRHLGQGDGHGVSHRI